jgi:hypothetical protein
LKNNKSKNTLRGKKDSVAPPIFVGTERVNNFCNTMIEMNVVSGHQTERSPIFSTTRRSTSKNPNTLEEAKVPLNSARRAMRKIEKSLDSQIAGVMIEQIEHRKKETPPPDVSKLSSTLSSNHRQNFV